jgi:predicted lipoprotein
MKKGLILLVIAFIGISVPQACKKPASNDTTPTETNGFDKKAMLTHYADDLIMPAYAAMQQKIIDLQTASDAFIAAPSAATQATVKTAFTAAYQQYQRVVAFQFGPAETALLDVYVNYSGGLDYSFTTAGQLTGFSVDTLAIENNISTGTYNLTTVNRSNLYAQGFPALGYLYFAPNATGKFATNGPARNQYIKDVVARIKSLVDKVASDWTAYRTEFIANTQTSNGSPIGNIVNQLAYQLDMLKGPRLGWPLGKQSNGVVFETKCEGYYAGNSIALATENLKALKKLYTGENSKNGIADYLIALKKGTLNDEVLAQFDIALAKLVLIPDPLSASLVSQPALADAAYKEVQKLLTLLKTDVASATAVQITFTDNDGD